LLAGYCSCTGWQDAEIRKNLDSRRQVGAQLNQEKVTMTSNLSLMKNAATKVCSFQ
jgi:hypothetical protein